MIENYTRYKNRNISLNYLLRVLPVFIIPVVVMVTIYISSNNIINQQTYQRNTAILENSAVTIQKTFNDMDNLISYLDHSPEINNFLDFINPVKDGTTTMDLINVQSNLKSLTIANDIIANIQLYSKKNNILIDSATSALFLKRYYEYKYISGVKFEDWESKYLNVWHKQDIITDTELVIGGVASKNIIYANSLPLSDSSNLKGSVFIYLNEKYLINQYKNIPYADNGFICIINKAGEVILYDGTFNMDIVTDNLDDFIEKSGYLIKNIDGEDLFITYYNDTARSWTYIAALPNVKVLEPTAKIRLYIGILIVFTILVGGFCCFHLFPS